LRNNFQDIIANNLLEIIYFVVSLLILLFNNFIFVLFYVVQRYNILNILKSNFDTKDLVYLEALNQLFVDLYVIKIYFIDLFSLVKDNQNRVVYLD